MTTQTWHKYDYYNINKCWKINFLNLFRLIANYILWSTRFCLSENSKWSLKWSNWNAIFNIKCLKDCENSMATKTPLKRCVRLIKQEQGQSILQSGNLYDVV